MYKRQFTICYFKCSQENLLPFKVRAPKFSLILHCWCMSLFLNHLRDLDNHLFQRDRNKTYLLRLLYVYIKKKKKRPLYPLKQDISSLKLSHNPHFIDCTNFYLQSLIALIQSLQFLCINSFCLWFYRLRD